MFIKLNIHAQLTRQSPLLMSKVSLSALLEVSCNPCFRWHFPASTMHIYTLWAIKTCHSIFVHNFEKCWPILKLYRCWTQQWACNRLIRYDTIRYDSVYLTYSEKLTGSQLSPPHGLCYTSHRASLNVSIHYLAAYKRSTIAILLTYLTQCWYDKFYFIFILENTESRKKNENAKYETENTINDLAETNIINKYLLDQPCWVKISWKFSGVYFTHFVQQFRHFIVSSLNGQPSRRLRNYNS